MIPQRVNLTQVTPEDYQQMYETFETLLGDRFQDLGLEDCNIQNELNKVAAGMILSRWQTV